MISALHLFGGYGVELEYMIVDRENLSVKPITDKVIFDVIGEYVSDAEFDETSWSNELVLHVIEMKTNGPRKDLNKLDELFANDVKSINKILKNYNCMLMPTGMHPFMNPLTETKLWPHEYNITYETYNKIFNCKGHGWSNLQSVHLNLPFYNDEEFKKLHAAIRLLLPIIPAISASTPVIDGKLSGYYDTRLEVYRKNQEKIPSIAGKVIPERVFSKSDYETEILKKIYSDLSFYDAEGILKNEWVNSRGATARFERKTIEIRIIDIQECPSADLAVVNSIVNVLKLLINEKWIKLDEQIKWDEERLSQIFLKIIKEGEDAVIEDEDYLRVFNYTEDKKSLAKNLWKYLIEQIIIVNNIPGESWIKNIELILNYGSLSSRIIKSLEGNYSGNNIFKTYMKLSESLASNKMFIP
ncbi:MAG: glutamate-cysteine ligase family protein [Ignavibacteriaceae bacterium]